MKKENYFTIENRRTKVNEWKQILLPYSSSKRKIRLNKTTAALLIIDMQEYFLNQKSPAFIPASEAIIEPIKKLQQAFSRNKYIIIYTQYGLESFDNGKSIMLKWWGGVLKKTDPYYQLSETFDTRGATLISKTSYDAFIGTPLLEFLTKQQITELVITGVITHLCCETTARSAFCNNFNVFLPIDCMATYTEEMHLNTLKAAAHGFGMPTTSEEILEVVLFDK